SETVSSNDKLSSSISDNPSSNKFCASSLLPSLYSPFISLKSSLSSGENEKSLGTKLFNGLEPSFKIVSVNPSLSIAISNDLRILDRKSTRLNSSHVSISY